MSAADDGGFQGERLRYDALVEYLGGQATAGRLTPEQFDRLLAADTDLYVTHLASRNDAAADPPPLRYALAVADILTLLADRHAALAAPAVRVTGRPARQPDGFMRYYTLVRFLDEKVRAGELTATAHRALVSVNPVLHEDYTEVVTGGTNTVDMNGPRAAATADAIRRQLALRHPALAREFDQDGSGPARGRS